MENIFLTIGEIMMRLSTPYNNRIEQCRSFDINYGGAEANFAIALSQLGGKVRFVTALPDNQLAKPIFWELKKFDIDCDYIVITNEGRLGLYFLETGSSIRPSKVIYDRKGSSFAVTDIEKYDINGMFKNVKHLHITGITLALSEKTFLLCENVLKKAKEVGISTSIDLNYRKKLWSREKAIEYTKKVIKYFDIISGNEEDCYNMLGIDVDDLKNLELEKKYEEISKRVFQLYTPKIVLTSLRESISANTNLWSGVVYDGKDYIVSRKIKLDGIVDRVGAGDSFTAGFVYGFIGEKKSLEDSLNLGVALSAYKHTINGDYTIFDKVDIEEILKGNLSGRIVR